MAFSNLREFIDFLEEKGDLRRITEPVSRDLEITEITDRTIKSGGPALLFENVEGYEMPLAINLYGAHQRMAWALGVDDVDEITQRVRKLLGMIQGPPEGIVPKLKALGDLASVARSRPKIVKNAPCQEVTISGDDVDLNAFPILKCWPLDAGRFITLPLVISHDPVKGNRNVGTYRMQVYDKRTTGMHWQSHKVGARHAREGVAQDVDRLDVAVALGGDPVTIWSGSMPLPPDIDEFVAAGFIRGKPVELVKCKTNDLEVPAQAEIVLEGYVIPGEIPLRRALRRPYRLLLAGRRLLGVSRRGYHPPQRPHLSHNDGRQTAYRGLLHGKGQRANHAPGPTTHPARGRRLQHARRRHIHQLRSRLDEEGVSRSRS